MENDEDARNEMKIISDLIEIDQSKVGLHAHSRELLNELFEKNFDKNYDEYVNNLAKCLENDN